MRTHQLLYFKGQYNLNTFFLFFKNYWYPFSSRGTNNINLSFKAQKKLFNSEALLFKININFGWFEFLTKLKKIADWAFKAPEKL